MVILGIDRHQLETAAESVGVALYELNATGSGYRFTIRPHADPERRERYRRRSAGYTSRGRKVHAVCWHGHRDFFRAVFELAPAAKARTAFARYDGAEDFESSFRATADHQIGPEVAPITIAEACSCGEGAFDPETGAFVDRPAIRVIPQAAFQACPHFILALEHYRADNTCRCNDPAHTEMGGWGYIWSGEKWT